MAKIKWLKEGDQKSKFFHVVFNARHNKALIMKLVDGSVLGFVEDVHEGAVKHFQDFLAEQIDR